MKFFNKAGEIGVYIYEYDNYPLCHLDNIDQKKLSKVEGYNIYFYHSYKKNEWDNNISPISKKQNMLIIECKNGGYEGSINACIFSVNMKIDNNNIIF